MKYQKNSQLEFEIILTVIHLIPLDKELQILICASCRPGGRSVTRRNLRQGNGHLEQIYCIDRLPILSLRNFVYILTNVQKHKFQQ